MSTQNQVSICNLSLLSIGSRVQISSINPSDGSQPADACSTLFSFVFEQLARTARWSCLKKQITATLTQAAQGTPENLTGTSLSIPQQFWLYAYLYPSDCLMVREVLPPTTPSAGVNTPQTTLANSVTPWVGYDQQIPYEIGYSTDNSGNPIQVILTNQESAVINYTVNQQNPQSWDALFTAAYVASLAAYLVPALSLAMPLMQTQIKIAEEIISTARAQDGNEGVRVQDHFPDWLQARQGATGVQWYAPKLNAFGFIQMNWPC